MLAKLWSRASHRKIWSTSQGERIINVKFIRVELQKAGIAHFLFQSWLCAVFLAFPLNSPSVR